MPRSGQGDYLSQNEAAAFLGISWETFDDRRKAGVPLYQPDFVDPDSHRRSWSRIALTTAQEELGRIKAWRTAEYLGWLESFPGQMVAAERRTSWLDRFNDPDQSPN